MKKQLTSERWMFIPIIGIVLFVVSYFLSANSYPGGSNADNTQEGFNWIHNYWCDLLSETAKNGTRNTGRIFSMAGMVVLFSSLAVFWYHLPVFFHERKRNILIVRYAGSLAMFILIFIFTPFHDGVIAIGSAISAIPMAATLNELKKYHLKGLYFLGWFCIFLILLNFLIYFTNRFIFFLPILQKITFLFFLVWIVIIALKCLAIDREWKRSEAPLTSGHFERKEIGKNLSQKQF